MESEYKRILAYEHDGKLYHTIEELKTVAVNKTLANLIHYFRDYNYSNLFGSVESKEAQTLLNEIINYLEESTSKLKLFIKPETT
jgi:hypothetical protein